MRSLLTLNFVTRLELSKHSLQRR